MSDIPATPMPAPQSDVRLSCPRCRAAGSVTTVTAVLAQRRVEVTLTGDDTATVAVNGQPIVGVTAAGGGVDVWPDGQT